MFCPFCGEAADENIQICPCCGASLLPPKAKKGCLWPAFLALVLIFAFGLGIFLLFRPEITITTDPSAPWFSLRNGSLYFDEFAYDGSGELTVPATLGGQTVTALSDGCFYDCDSLIAIHLPDTLTYIGADAFALCDSLRAVQLPESLEALESGAFYDCPSLEALSIPASLKAAGSEIFTGCESLSYLFYSGSLASWKSLGFYDIPRGAVLYCTDGLYTMN